MKTDRTARSLRRVARTACIWTFVAGLALLAFVVGAIVADGGFDSRWAFLSGFALQVLLVSAVVWGAAMGTWHVLK